MVPEGWELITLGDACLPKGGLQTGPFGSQLHAHEYVSDGIPVVMPRDLDSGRIMTAQIARVPQAKVDSLTKHKLKVGDIVFARRGEIGRYAVVNEDEKGWLCGTGCLRARPLSSMSSIFLGYQIGLPRSIVWLNSNAVGQTMLNLNTEILGELPVLLPPKPEQERIASILSTWDTAITQMVKLIEAKQKLKKGLMQQLLIGKRRFPGFKDQWQMMSVKNLCTYIGSGGTPSTSVPEYWSGTIPWITGADFTERGIRVVRRYITDEAVQSSATRVCPQGSILLVSRTGVGKIALAPFNIAISQDITVLELTPDFTDPQFILFALAMSLSRLQRFNQGTSINGVMRKDLICHKILVPSLQEQRKIATVLRVMDSEIDSLTSCVEQLKEQKRGLMQKLLTGQIRVKATEEIKAS
jgi:type I restriction enzyme S subunit